MHFLRLSLSQHVLQLKHQATTFILSISSHRTTSSHTNRTLALPPKLSSPPTAAESATARTWLTDFTKASIPRDGVELSFARSSGPGGQNVNKVNTKASVRCALDKAWIPQWARNRLMRAPAYVASSRSLLITSTLHRTQAQNVEDCFDKLHALIHSTCLAVIPTPADPARMARKAAYERADAQRRRAAKIYRSAVKGGRRGGGKGD